MFTISYLLELRNMAANLQYCNDTVKFLENIIYGDISSNEVYLNEDYEYTLFEGSLGEYCVKRITQELENKNICIVELANSSGSDKTFIHTFILFKTIDSIFRLESYGSFGNREKEDYCHYQTRLVEWSSYEKDLSKLMNYEPSKCRVEYWNGLFSANEKDDSDFNMDMIIFTRD